ncbi:aminoacyl-tRNA hydrolase [Azotobacter sp. CWF10]
MQAAQPATFMNLSGKSVTAAQRFWKIEPEEPLLAHDELDLPPGAARLKFDGGHGGQNGLRDTIRLLGHGKFHRLRVGIVHASYKDRVVGWVLGRPSKEDDVLIARAIDDAIDVAAGGAGRFQRSDEAAAHPALTMTDPRTPCTVWRHDPAGDGGPERWACTVVPEWHAAK